MKHSRLLSCLVAALTFGVAAPVVAAESHDHHEAAPAKLRLDNGRKWPTDAPLRQSMASLRTELAGKLHAIHAGRLAKEEYAALGKTIEGQVGTIVSQCKLEPKADAMLHIVIADLVAAADVMQGKAAGKPAAAAHRAVTAVNGYGKHFDHPEWQALK